MYFGNITISHHFDSVRTVWSLIANSSSQKDAPPKKNTLLWSDEAPGLCGITYLLLEIDRK